LLGICVVELLDVMLYGGVGVSVGVL